MRYFEVNVRDYPTEYGFMPSLQLYLVEKSDNPRPIVIIAPGGRYTKCSSAFRTRRFWMPAIR